MPWPPSPPAANAGAAAQRPHLNKMLHRLGSATGSHGHGATGSDSLQCQLGHYSVSIIIPAAVELPVTAARWAKATRRAAGALAEAARWHDPASAANDMDGLTAAPKAGMFWLERAFTATSELDERGAEAAGASRRLDADRCSPRAAVASLGATGTVCWCWLPNAVALSALTERGGAAVAGGAAAVRVLAAVAATVLEVAVDAPVSMRCFMRISVAKLKGWASVTDPRRGREVALVSRAAAAGAAVAGLSSVAIEPDCCIAATMPRARPMNAPVDAAAPVARVWVGLVVPAAKRTAGCASEPSRTADAARRGRAAGDDATATAAAALGAGLGHRAPAPTGAGSLELALEPEEAMTACRALGPMQWPRSADPRRPRARARSSVTRWKGRGLVCLWGTGGGSGRLTGAWVSARRKPPCVNFVHNSAMATKDWAGAGPGAGAGWASSVYEPRRVRAGAAATGCGCAADASVTEPRRTRVKPAPAAKGLVLALEAGVAVAEVADAAGVAAAFAAPSARNLALKLAVLTCVAGAGLVSAPLAAAEDVAAVESASMVRGAGALSTALAAAASVAEAAGAADAALVAPKPNVTVRPLDWGAAVAGANLPLSTSTAVLAVAEVLPAAVALVLAAAARKRAAPVGSGLILMAAADGGAGAGAGADAGAAAVSVSAACVAAATEVAVDALLAKAGGMRLHVLPPKRPVPVLDSVEDIPVAAPAPVAADGGAALPVVDVAVKEACLAVAAAEGGPTLMERGVRPMAPKAGLAAVVVWPRPRDALAVLPMPMPMPIISSPSSSVAAVPVMALAAT